MIIPINYKGGQWEPAKEVAYQALTSVLTIANSRWYNRWLVRDTWNVVLRLQGSKAVLSGSRYMELGRPNMLVEHKSITDSNAE